MKINQLSKENIEKLLSVKQLAVWHYLERVGEASPREIAKNAKVARPTVNQALNRLMRLKKVERIGLGRSTRYRRTQIHTDGNTDLHRSLGTDVRLGRGAI